MGRLAPERGAPCAVSFRAACLCTFFCYPILAACLLADGSRFYSGGWLRMDEHLFVANGDGGRLLSQKNGLVLVDGARHVREEGSFAEPLITLQHTYCYRIFYRAFCDGRDGVAAFTSGGCSRYCVPVYVVLSLCVISACATRGHCHHLHTPHTTYTTRRISALATAFLYDLIRVAAWRGVTPNRRF
jgi:hypothetical protein